MWLSVRQSFGQFKVGTEGKFKYMYCDVNGYVRYSQLSRPKSYEIKIEAG